MDYKKKLPTLSKYLNQLSEKHLKNKIKLYQDISSHNIGSRGQTDKRWKLIKNKLVKSKVKNLLDLGSAEGFFLKKTTKLNIMSLGIEADERRYFLSNSLSEKNKIYGVINSTIKSKLIKLLPIFDATLYLSVHHHISASLGHKEANKILVEIFKKTKKSLFFETAMKDEKSKSWNRNYDKILQHITEENVKNFFIKLGCKKIQILGYTNSYNKGYKRPLFYIKK
jgi:hypothetical protein